MSDLVVWLRQQLDTDEAHARKDIWAAERATAGRWVARYGVNLPASWVETESGPVAKLDGGRHEADALLVARFRPDNVRERAERVLRQVQAHRAILAAHAVWPRRVRWYDEAGDLRDAELPVCGTCTRRDDTFDARDAVPVGRCATTVMLASVYSDRDGYRQEWSTP